MAMSAISVVSAPFAQIAAGESRRPAIPYSTKLNERHDTSWKGSVAST
jgi:hypothetical protein